MENQSSEWLETQHTSIESKSIITYIIHSHCPKTNTFRNVVAEANAIQMVVGAEVASISADGIRAAQGATQYRGQIPDTTLQQLTLQNKAGRTTRGSK